MSYATPITERPTLSVPIETLIRQVMLVSCAPTDIDGSIFYLPLADIDEIQPLLVEEAEADEETRRFLEDTTRYLTCISGLSGKKLSRYQGGDVIRCLLNDESQCIVYDT